jgi:hypothetical protein
MTRKTIEHEQRMKTIVPTGSYAIDVPVEVNEQIEDGVVSLWVPQDDTLLQLSSFKRETEHQVPAMVRLEARLNREQLSGVRFEHIDISACPDVAAASGRDDEGIQWLYVYAAWRDLTVFVTISVPDAQPTSITNQWALVALTSLRRPDYGTHVAK